MSKYKLTFRLKQHTPMIHFQADQHGATLRASELKPKLDRFIIDQIGLTKTVVVKGENKEIQRDEFKDWFISEQHLALDYQVKIKATNIKKNVIHNGSDKVPNFFANIGDNYKDVYLTKADQIFVEIIVMNQSLKEKIDSYFGQFLLGTNFGMRQSKGFGSYSLENHPFESTDFDLSFDIDTSQIPSNLWRRRNGLFEDWHHELQLFGAIEIFYKSLRSGINRKGPNQVPIFYIKPAIFYFAMQVLKKQWDKKSIKQAYLSRKLAEQRGNYSNPDILSFSDSDDPHILIKDVFGLSSSENWKYYHQTVSKNHPEIKRFQSPLVFKPVQINVRCFKVGINCRSIHEDYLGSIFDVSLGNQKGLKLKVPETFSWSDFWDFYLGNKSKKMPKLNERLGGIPDEKRQPEYSIIKQIEQTLKRHVS